MNLVSIGCKNHVLQNASFNALEVGWEINLEKVDPVKVNKKSSFKLVSYKTAMQLCGRTSHKGCKYI